MSLRWTVIILPAYFFFFNDTATTEIYTLSLHDALPISPAATIAQVEIFGPVLVSMTFRTPAERSEEHTSELQSQSNLVCRLLLEKKKKKNRKNDQHQQTQEHRYYSVEPHQSNRFTRSVN